MKKFLPIILAIAFCFVSLSYPFAVANAQPAPAQQQTASPAAGLWVVDPEVTFIGKNAARSGYVLNWTLLNYQWVCVTKVADRNCDNAANPLAQFWWTIVLYIVMPLLILVILATSMIIIISRGRSLTIMRFIPRFTAVLILIALSYAILQFLYQFTDLIQGFFLRSGTTNCPPDCISNQDLLFVGWNYQDFVGLRLLGDYNAESAFISLLLTKLTALTYYVMVGILLIRKIILWFFIIVSPVFPLLLLFYPVRNTGKIWIGEFFRWLLYGPLFAIFLQGLVFMWRQAIPLQFVNPAIQDPTRIIYPTAVNILLGGPRQFVTPTNSVNLTETFMLYVVALIMLWIVILLPWILLQIFLDYASNFAGDNAMMKNLVTLVGNKMVPPKSPTGYPPGTQPGGTALTLPFTKKSVNIPIALNPTMRPGGAAKQIIRETQSAHTALTYSVPHAQINAEVLSFANIPLPTMRDIARYDTALTSNNASQRQEVSRMSEMLEKIGNPVAVTSTVERERFVNMNDRLVRESQQGNIVATTILNAINSAANNQSKRNIQATDSHLRNILQQIANPAQTSNLVDREKMSQLHSMLKQESKEKNNQLASSILSVNDKTTANELDKIRDQLVKESSTPVATTVSATVKASQLKGILQQIASPASVTNSSQREKMTKLHDMLSHESKENNNQLATSILQVKDTTTLAELEKISEKLQQSKDSTVSSQVLTAISSSHQQSQNMTKVKEVLQQIANPASASTVNKEKMSKLHEALTKESQKGNELATSLLSVNKSTTTADIQKLSEKLKEAKSKGESVATDVLATAAQQANINVPTTNRIQTVTPEELAEVKKMWTENYNNMEVPEGMAGTRTEWVKDDIEKIGNLTALLTSSDQEKVNQGLSEVANILPFLLVGGFSQTEIVSYLQTKQDAAKEVLESLKTEEETKLTVETKHQEAAQTMAVKIEAPSVEISTPSFATTSVAAPVVSNEILTMVNLKLPKMRDIARFETMSISRDKSHVGEVQKVRETLERIANPSTVTITTERDKFDKLREKLLEESQKGNTTAQAILSAATSATEKHSTTPITVKVKDVLFQIANPASVTNPEDKERFNKLHGQLLQSSQQGNELAASLLKVNKTTTNDDIQKLSDKLKEEQLKGESVATSVLGVLPQAVSLPTTNRIQTVTPEELAEVKKMWTENYNNMEVPEGMAGTRTEWVKDDIEKIGNLTALLTSSDQEKVNQGLSEVANILPFLLVGGFSQTEIVSYLQTKQDAAKEVLESLKTEEETKLTVETKHQEAAQTMAVKIEAPSVEISTPSFATTSVAAPVVSNEILTMVNLKLPTMKDIVRFEAMSLARDKSQITEMHKAHVILANLATPANVQIPADRQKIENLRQKLLDESQKGDKTADTILKAAKHAVSPHSEINTSDVPESNKLQSVTQKDYTEIEKLWEENYRTLPVPFGFNDDKEGRIEWITKEIEEIKTTLDLLRDADAEKKNEGLKKVGTILPFLLLGGFSYQEINEYLNVKLKAAKIVLSELKLGEEKEEKVEVGSKKEEEPKVLSAEEEIAKK